MADDDEEEGGRRRVNDRPRVRSRGIEEGFEDGDEFLMPPRQPSGDFASSEAERFFALQALVGADPSLRDAAADDQIPTKNASKIIRFLNEVKRGIYTKNPLLVDAETGGIVGNPLLQLSARVLTTETNLLGAGSVGDLPDTAGFDPEYALLYDSVSPYRQSTDGRTIQFPLRAPMRGFLTYLYFHYDGTAGSLIFYLLNRDVPVATNLSVTTERLRRYIVFQRGSTASPVTDVEFTETMDPPHPYTNQAVVSNVEAERWRLWLRIQAISGSEPVMTGLDFNAPIIRGGL